MNNELKALIALVKTDQRAVRVIVDEYFETVAWSLLKDEWLRMDPTEKTQLIMKLEISRIPGLVK